MLNYDEHNIPSVILTIQPGLRYLFTSSNQLNEDEQRKLEQRLLAILSGPAAS